MFFEAFSTNPLNAYQLLLPMAPEPMDGATGSIDYIDNNPGAPGGDTVVIDTLRDDWLFANEPVVLSITYNETAGQGFFGVFYATIPGTGIDASALGIAYTLEAQFTASADACGDFEARIRLAPKAPPLSAFFNALGQSFGVVEYQNLIITVDGPSCGAGCTDPCSDDDVCTVDDACEGDVCVGVPVDCSKSGDECNVATCDAAGEDGNCATLTPVEDGTACGVAGQCMAGVCEEPGCEDPCDDGDACTLDDACEDDVCVGTPVDCSGAGDECNVASCDGAGADGNCDTLTPVADGTKCGDAGLCMSGVCEEQGECQKDGECDDANECTTDTCTDMVCSNDPVEDGTACGAGGTCQGGACVIVGDNDTRVFMAVDGEQASEPTFGATSITMDPGATQRVMVFFEDITDDADVLEGYQVLMPYAPVAQAGASGTVDYVDVDPGEPGGNSVFIDTLRDDWVFDASPVATLPVYNETPGEGFFGVFYAAVPSLGIEPGGAGILYVFEFEYTASGDANGDFLVKFRLAPKNAPLSAFFRPMGTEFEIDEFQDLIITVEGKGGDLCPVGDVEFTDPPNGVVDARQPNPTDDANILLGIETLVVTAPSGADMTCWSLCENAGDPANSITAVSEDMGVYTITLARPITPGELTTVTYTDDDGGQTVGSFIAHPANVNGDDVSTAGDILALIDVINGVTEAAYGTFSSDIDHSGKASAEDVLALIELLDGIDAQEVWLNSVVPAGPCD